MESGQEFLVHQLKDILDGERKILRTLEEGIQESRLPELKRSFEQHHQQTEKQIQRLEQCFQELDEEPEQSECAGIKGIIEEKKLFMQQAPSDKLIDLFNVGSASKIEHYEIAAYTGLIDLGQKMGERGVVRLLQQNLREEEQMLKKCESIIKKSKPEQLGAEEVEEEPSRGRTGRKAA
jgi:ferritin-like metal-binding protein YciE